MEIFRGNKDYPEVGDELIEMPTPLDKTRLEHYKTLQETDLEIERLTQVTLATNYLDVSKTYGLSSMELMVLNMDRWSKYINKRRIEGMISSTHSPKISLN